MEELNIAELIESGNAWRMEGSVGRSCMAAIECGEVMLGTAPVRDFYGNLVPSWWMVDAGTKGSPEFAGIDRPEEPSDEAKTEMLAAVGITWEG